MFVLGLCVLSMKMQVPQVALLEKVIVNRFLVTAALAIYVYICRFFMFLASVGPGSYVSIVFWLFLYAELSIDMCMCVCNSRF